MTLEDLIVQLAARVGISETQLRMQLAAPTDLVRDIVNDQRRNPVEPASAVPDKGPGVVSTKGNGWQNQQGLEMPLGRSGQDRIAEICDHFLGPAVPKKK